MKTEHESKLTHAVCLVGLALLFTGCASSEREVQRVAKDWCMTIRGSQVIPVYPLTEDIQPGDIFLVQMPIDQQQRLYQKKGFLPLDNHLDRIDPAGYSSFYDHSFFPRGVTNELPRDWTRPTSTNRSWQLAPHAAFPSYSFTVRNGAGINLAVPVHGVPVGLSLLASDAASGTIEIKDAYTFGVDTVSLYRQVRDWAAANADFLRYFGSSAAENKNNFLRVVTRVYATGRMSVSLKDATSRGGGLDGGVPKPVDLLMPSLPASTTNSAEAAIRNYTNAWSVLSEIVKAASTATNAAGNLLPGGSLRLAAASARTVSLDETFDPPVILGYLGFDCAIFKGGILGPPIPTHAVLDPSYRLGHLLAINPIYGQMLNLVLYEIIKKDTTNPTAKDIAARLDALEAYAPNKFTEYHTEGPVSRGLPLIETELDGSRLHNPDFPGYGNYHAFHASLQASIQALEYALRESVFTFKRGSEPPVPADSPLRRQLEQTLTYYKNLAQRVTEDPIIQRAISDAHGYYLEFLAR